MSPGNQDILQQPADRVHFAPETIETTHSFKEDIPQLLYRDDIKKGDRMQPDYVHEVIFVIRQKNMDKLTLMLHDISDPLSANYGYHLSGDEIATLTSNPESLNAVANFLVLNGVSAQSQSLHGEYLTANATVLIWEEMFNTEFYSFDVLQNKKVEAVVRAERYWIPKELELHVESVLNTIQIPRVIYGDLGRIRSQGLRTEIVPPGAVTPAKLKQFYNITTKGSARSTQGIFATVQLYFSPADLASFQTQLAPPAYPVSTIIGDHSSDSYCIQTPGSCAEPNLDLQYIMSMSPGSPTTYWYTDQSFTDWLVSVAAYPNRPLVFSISYGSSESSMSGSELNAFNTQMIKLGAMGVTVVVATGDDGANSPEVRSSSYGTSACGYSPVFPASSPYVTSVGATKGLESGVPEVVCQGDQQGGITSGGGFSTYYPRLPFQTSSIAGYFAAAATAGQTPIVGFGSGRGYPDVALLGHSYTVVIGGGSYFVSGTSASSPTMAGLFSNINAARLASGRGSIGWANPVLYQHSKLFVNDIVSGNNLCAADGTCCTQGFHAAPGWDPTTGLGSINFGKMVSFWGTLGNITGVPDPVPTSTPSTASTSSPVIAPAHPVNSSSAKTPTFTPTFSPTSDTNPLSVFYNMSGKTRTIVENSAFGGLGLVVLICCVATYLCARNKQKDQDFGSNRLSLRVRGLGTLRRAGAARGASPPLIPAGAPSSSQGESTPSSQGEAGWHQAF